MIVQKPWWPHVPEDVKDLFSRESLVLMGVTDALPSPEEEQIYRRWLANGHHGTMGFMERHAHAKFRPEAILPGVRSILFAGLNYYQKRPASPEGQELSGRIARYARGRDYHKELGKRLKRIARRLAERYPSERFRAFTDATPLSERYYAEKAGLGFTGRHTLLINGAYGSWFFLGEILSTRYFSPGEEAETHHGGCPRSCRRCIDVCPTGALLGSRKIDASRCISYLTIEHDGIIPEELRRPMGQWIFGCDLCQEVCPLNVRAGVTDVKSFITPIAGDSVSLRELLSMDTDEQFLRRFAGSPVMRAGRSRMIRNALTAAGNSGNTALLPLIEKYLDSENNTLQVHAAWALKEVKSPSRG
jgi:epoxyqueuosine reductase